jgi:RNA polymerase sigma factor (sigma-70 family)
MNSFDDPKLRCSAIVRQLMEDHDWRLLSEDAFVQVVLECIPPEGSNELRKWCINTYCQQALHPACLGALGEKKRKRGFEELATYLYRLAHWKWPHIAEDAVQEALVRVYDRVDQCRNPGAFLAFAIQQLRDAAKKLSKAKTRELSLDELLEQDFYGDMSADKAVGMAEEERVEEAALYADLKRQVAARIKQVRRQNPRAHRQLNAVCLRYFRELSNAEIATVLKTTPENVSVLISRGLEKLRKDKQLWDLAEEILRQPGDGEVQDS